MVLGVPLPALAQTPAGGSDAQAPTGVVTTPVGPLHLQPETNRVTRGVVASASTSRLLADVAPEDLAQLRADLLLLVQTLNTLGPKIADHNVETGFSEANVNALTDAELTAYYNALPDVAGFHMAVASLADMLQHPVAHQAHSETRAEVAPGTTWAPKLKPGSMTLASLPFSQALPSGRVDRGTNPISVCPQTRSDDATTFGLLFVANSLQIAASALDAGCQIFIDIPCPVGSGGKFPPLCIAAGAAQAAQLAFAFAIDLAGVCDANFTNRTVQASWENSKAIHTNLDAHNMDIMTILTEFRELVIRVGVEENLLMNADQRLSMFQLPQGPHTAVSIQRTRAIVLDTIQRNLLAGMPIGNAQAEFAAGETLLAQNLYKDAYARYRNAYRAAVGQTIR
jgi:hypothetical protein